MLIAQLPYLNLFSILYCIANKKNSYIILIFEISIYLCMIDTCSNESCTKQFSCFQRISYVTFERQKLHRYNQKDHGKNFSNVSLENTCYSLCLISTVVCGVSVHCTVSNLPFPIGAPFNVQRQQVNRRSIRFIIVQL